MMAPSAPARLAESTGSAVASCSATSRSWLERRLQMLLLDPQLEAKARIQFEEALESTDAAATSSTGTTRCSLRP